jgi:hypothetical protein
MDTDFHLHAIMQVMENFRQFQAGPDPFGRTWEVLFKWMQTAISIRHSDTVDVKFILREGDDREEKTIAMQHADLLRLSREADVAMTDAWCSRLAALHLKYLIGTGEDLEKTLVTASYGDLARHNDTLKHTGFTQKLPYEPHLPSPANG